KLVCCAAGCATCARSWASYAWWPTPRARPGSSSTSSARPIETTRCAGPLRGTTRLLPASHGLLPPHDYQHRVGRPGVALAVGAEHGEGVVARLQIPKGELGRPVGQFRHLFRPVVQL